MGILGAIFANIKNMKSAKKWRAMGADEILKLCDDDFFDAILSISSDAVFDINDTNIPQEQKILYSLLMLEVEVSNGGLCQFFVNSSRECAPYISDALALVGADGIKKLFDDFIEKNSIDVNDLSSFIIGSIDEFAIQTKRYDFDSFDDKFYEYESLQSKIIAYAKENLEVVLK